MKFRTLKKTLLVRNAVFLGLGLLFATTFSNAQTVTFAQYTQRVGGQDFTFTNNGSSATFQTVASGSPVNFNYLNIPNLPVELRGIQNAHVYFSSTTTAPAVNSSGSRTIQPFNGVFNILIYRDAPASVGTGNRTNLLTIAITPGGTSNSELSGDSGASSAGYTASTPVQNVTYTSDFLSFEDTTQRNLSLGFSSITPLYSLGTTFLNSFTAAGTGTFASNPPPVFLTPTAATLTINGQVLTPRGKGLANARVTLTTSSGATLVAMTDSEGFYEFLDVDAGDTVIINVRSKLYAYEPQVLNLSGDTNGLIFLPTSGTVRTR